MQNVEMMMDRLKDVHKRAAIGYGVLGVLVIGITFAADLVPRSRIAQLAELGVGAVFVVIFAAVIYRQPRIELGRIHISNWWWLSALLVFSNAWRAFTYFNDGLGWHVEIANLSVTRVEPQPIAFVNAALMAIIVILLARSAWAGFSSWRAQRLEVAATETPSPPTRTI